MREDKAEQRPQAFWCDCTVMLPTARWAGDYCELDIDECESGQAN